MAFWTEFMGYINVWMIKITIKAKETNLDVLLISKVDNI